MDHDICSFNPCYWMWFRINWTDWYSNCPYVQISIFQFKKKNIYIIIKAFQKRIKWINQFKLLEIICKEGEMRTSHWRYIWLFCNALLFWFHFILAFGDLVVQFNDKNVSTRDLLLRLNMTSGRFDVRDICPSMRYSCELACPLDKEDQERVYDKPCYCDRLCVELGDCCYDYFSRLVN